MALEVGASQATAQVNGSINPSSAEQEELCDRLLKLRDVVIAGKHPLFRLPDSTVAELKASLILQSTQDNSSTSPQLIGVSNDFAFATNQTQLQQSSSFPTFTGLLGLQASSPYSQTGQSTIPSTKPANATTLDPIFLEKSDSLVRAEGQLKRQRLDRDIQTQIEQRKHATRDKEPTSDAPSLIDVDLVYLNALQRVNPVSGLKEAAKQGSAASSSFDENDYYSSQVQSDWSSEASSSKASDTAVGAFTADFERLDGDPAAPSLHGHRLPNAKAQPAPGSAPQQPPLPDSQDDEYEPGEVLEIEDEDDDYMPPDASAFDSSRDYVPRAEAPLITPPEDDNSDYEPGEITDDNIVTPAQQVQQPAQKSPNVQIVRNHLTHLAAPQPNRVSPLATAKGPSIELELVNGRPEVVQKPAPRSNYVYSRATSASPSGNGVSGSGKKRRSKKRKRDQEPTGRSKRRRERQNGFDEQYDQEQYIKDEPMSPPPFNNVPEVAQYPQYAPRPPEADVRSSRPAPRYLYVPESSRSGLRYEHTPSAPSAAVRVTSPSHRPLQRDTQDLRRIASLHHAHRPPSPGMYSPVTPNRTVSMTYGEPRGHQIPRPESNGIPQYLDQPTLEALQYHRAERSRSPPRVNEYRESYAERVASPSMMIPPPPAAPPRRIIVDQYGRRYYAEEPAPSPSSALPPRASAVPVEKRPQPEMMFEQVPSRSYATYREYDPADSRMAPPPPPSRRQIVPEQQPEYIDSPGYVTRSYSSRAPEPIRYAPAPSSPIYQEVRGYEAMPPPPAPAREPTSPVYVSRSYSARPEEPVQQAINYMRHASVAPPTQYVRQDAPPPQMRALSVMPGLDYNSSAQPQRTYTQAPQNVRYVDQNGNEVFPREVRQLSEFRYQ